MRQEKRIVNDLLERVQRLERVQEQQHEAIKALVVGLASWMQDINSNIEIMMNIIKTRDADWAEFTQHVKAKLDL